MLDTNIMMFGLPAALLIAGAGLWYFFGKRAGTIGAVVALILFALDLFKKNTVLKERVGQNEKDTDAIIRSNDVRRRSRDDSRGGKLRDDDGFRRD